MTNKNLVVQHNKIIEAKYRLSVGEQRLIKYLVSLIEPGDKDFKPYRIAAVDLMKLLDLSDKDFYRKIEVWSKRLISNVLTFEGEGGEKLQVAWLSSAEYLPKSGIVELEFSPKLKPFLLHLKSYFTAYELGNVIRLKHTYSIRIYELLKQHEKIGKRKFKLDKLRELLMLEEKEYQQFCDFRKRVLKTAQEELAEKTDLVFTWNEEKVKQKCVAIEFIIHSKKTTTDKAILENPPASAGLAPSEAERSESEGATPEENPALPSDLIGASARLVDLGVTPATAVELVAHYDTERILHGIAYTQALQKEGKVKNPAGFVVDAIKNEYRDNQAEERERKQKELALSKAEEKARKAREREQQALKEKANLLRKQAVEGFLAGLTQDQRQALEAEFVESNKRNTLLIQRYRKLGMGSASVQGCFSAFVFKEKVSLI